MWLTGFETADAIRHFAASVTILSPDDVRIAWQTHYVGDLRVINSCTPTAVASETAAWLRRC
eukprot:8106849-Ditylum_brightwellii.AAC.1